MDARLRKLPVILVSVATLGYFLWNLGWFSFLMPVIVKIYRRPDVTLPITYLWIVLFSLALTFLLKRQHRASFIVVGVTILYAALILFANAGMSKLKQTEQIIIYSIALQPLVFLGLIPMILNELDYRRIISFLVLFMAFFCMFGLSVYFFQIEQMFGRALLANGFSPKGFSRFGVFLNRNYEASFFQVLAPLSMYLYGHAKKLKPLWIGTFLIGCIHIWFTFSRGAQLGFAVALIPLFCALWLRKRRMLVASGLALTAVIAASLRFDKFASYKYLDQLTAMRDRDLYWKDAFVFLFEKNKWFWGTGYRGYWTLGYMPHNLFITQTLYYGILAPILWLTMLWLSLRSYCKLDYLREPFQEPRVFVASAVLGLMVSDMFADHLSMGLYFTAVLYWFLMGAAVAKKNLSASDQIAPNPEPIKQ